jgi:hypothetical protein
MMGVPSTHYRKCSFKWRVTCCCWCTYGTSYGPARVLSYFPCSPVHSCRLSYFPCSPVHYCRLSYFPCSSVHYCRLSYFPSSPIHYCRLSYS